LRIALDTYSDSSNLAPASVRDQALKYYELEHTLGNALHQWQPPHDELGHLARVAASTEKRDDNIRIRQLSYTCAIEYDTTPVMMEPVDLEINAEILNFNVHLTPPCVDAECGPAGRGATFVRVAGWDITTVNYDITINSLTLQIAQSNTHSDLDILISAAAAGYNIMVNGNAYSFGNSLPDDGHDNPQSVLIEVFDDLNNFITRTTFCLKRQSGGLVPFLMPLIKLPRKLAYDLRCSNPTPGTWQMPFDYYFEEGDGTMNIDTTVYEANGYTRNVYELDIQSGDVSLEGLDLDTIGNAKYISTIVTENVEGVDYNLEDYFEYSISCLA
jgi:hypothetical protein